LLDLCIAGRWVDSLWPVSLFSPYDWPGCFLPNVSGLSGYWFSRRLRLWRHGCFIDESNGLRRLAQSINTQKRTTCS
jgi:hypothetical protein